MIVLVTKTQYIHAYFQNKTRQAFLYLATCVSLYSVIILAFQQLRYTSQLTTSVRSIQCDPLCTAGGEAALIKY